jgi:hypothetical protein
MKKNRREVGNMCVTQKIIRFVQKEQLHFPESKRVHKPSVTQ